MKLSLNSNKKEEEDDDETGGEYDGLVGSEWFNYVFMIRTIK